MMDTEFEQKLQQMTTDCLIDIALSSDNLRLFTAKLDALWEISGRCKKYRELGYMPEIVLTVLEKKLELLKKTATVKATEKIKVPSAPAYRQYSGGFETDDTWVAEEELIQWSLASQRAPLPQNAFNRYLDLFQQILHVNVMADFS